jgi:hypothetical protein
MFPYVRSNYVQVISSATEEDLGKHNEHQDDPRADNMNHLFGSDLRLQLMPTIARVIPHQGQQIRFCVTLESSRGICFIQRHQLCGSKFYFLVLNSPTDTADFHYFSTTYIVVISLDRILIYIVKKMYSIRFRQRSCFSLRLTFISVHVWKTLDPPRFDPFNWRVDSSEFTNYL